MRDYDGSVRHIALIVAFALVATSADSARVAPALYVVSRAPLVIAGTHFRALERVTVSLDGVRRVVRTTRSGTFRANLGTPSGDRCSSTVRAVGRGGERAVLRLPRAMCLPALSP